MTLVSLADGKAHLRVTHDWEDALIDDQLAAATDIVLDYVQTQPDPPWTAATVPPRVKAAILLVLEDLYVHRGADDAPQLQAAGDRVADGYLSPRVTRLLLRLRKFALA